MSGSYPKHEKSEVFNTQHYCILEDLKKYWL